MTLLVLSVVVILVATLFPFDLHVPAGRSWSDAFGELGPEPFEWWALVDGAINVALFVPFGVAVARLAGRWRSASGSSLAVVIVALAAGAGASFAIEMTQGLALARHPSLNDVTANAFGAVGGALVVIGVGPTVERWLGSARSALRVVLLRRPAPLCIGWMVVVTAIALSSPLLTRPSGWDESYPMLLGDERGGGRPWSGDIESVRFVGRALTDAEVRRVMADPPVRFVPGPNPELVRAVERSSGFTLVLVVTPADLAQTGPARIFSISDGLWRRNLTVGQAGRDLAVRIRTPVTGADGTSPEIIVPDVFSARRPHRLAVRYDGVTLEVGLDDDLTAHRVTLGPAIASAVLVFPARTQRLRLGTPGPTVLELGFGLLVAFPIALGLAVHRLRRPRVFAAGAGAAGIAVAALAAHHGGRAFVVGGMASVDVGVVTLPVVVVDVVLVAILTVTLVATLSRWSRPAPDAGTVAPPSRHEIPEAMR